MSNFLLIEAITNPDIELDLWNLGKERSLRNAIESELQIKVDKIIFNSLDNQNVTVGFGGGVVTIDLSEKPNGMLNEDFIVARVGNVIKTNREQANL